MYHVLLADFFLPNFRWGSASDMNGGRDDARPLFEVPSTADRRTTRALFWALSANLKKNAKRGNARNIKAKTHFLTLTAVPYNKVMRQGGV